ncbi:MAG: ABC transporter ATP-binding protein [Candidatus Paceibacterota bacterium]
MKLLFSYIKKQKKVLSLALILAVINQVFSLLDPQIFRMIVDNYATKIASLSTAEFVQGIILLLLLSMGVALVSRIAKSFQDYYVSTVTQRVGADLYSHSITHSFSLPYAAFEDQRSGELLMKLQKARTDVQGLITSFVGVIFLTSVGMIFVVTYAFLVNWIIGLVYLLIIPTVGSAQFFLSKRIKATQKQIVTETASLAGSTTETMRNVELVKSLGLEEQETERLNNVNEQILSLELKKIKLIRMLSFVQGTMINAVRSALLFLMMWLIFERAITFGQFFSLYIYLFFIFGPLAELGSIANSYQETKASMEKLQEILEIKPQEKPKNPIKIGVIDSIKFEDIKFTYTEGREPSVENISLNIFKGETVAFVGPSGAGKTTMVKLLLGLYEPLDGKILISGTDSKEIDYDEVRRRIGYVSQDTQLFAGTIRENLLFVNPEATDEECLLALRNSSAMPIIDKEGKGLDTKIGEGGVRISGGEKQRLAIARALLRKPDLIIFDEATSSLDSITEKEITKTIKEITKLHPELITVMIAHRLSTISHSDKIFVMEKGKLSEEGKHQELLEKRGLYAALWREQEASL